MATHVGKLTTYTNTVPQKRVVTDRIVLASPYDIAAIQALGLKNESKFRFDQYTWSYLRMLEDTYTPRTTTIGDEFTNSNNCNYNNCNRFQVIPNRTMSPK